jgi:hypothetical protein
LGGFEKKVADKPRDVILQAPRGDAVLATPLDRYRRDVEALINLADTNKMNLILTTITVQNNDPGSAPSRKLAPYNDVLRAVARVRNVPLADINRAMTASYAADPAVRLTFDGERFNREGGILMAETIMRAMGLDARITPALRKSWQERNTYFSRSKTQ